MTYNNPIGSLYSYTLAILTHVQNRAQSGQNYRVFF